MPESFHQRHYENVNKERLLFILAVFYDFIPSYYLRVLVLIVTKTGEEQSAIQPPTQKERKNHGYIETRENGFLVDSCMAG